VPRRVLIVTVLALMVAAVAGVVTNAPWVPDPLVLWLVLTLLVVTLWIVESDLVWLGIALWFIWCVVAIVTREPPPRLNERVVTCTILDEQFPDQYGEPMIWETDRCGMLFTWESSIARAVDVGRTYRLHIYDLDSWPRDYVVVAAVEGEITAG
jgi:hypothetical protein